MTRPSTVEPADESAGSPATAPAWRRLDPRMLVVAPAQALVKLLPVLVVLLLTGRGNTLRVWITLALAGLVVLGGIVRWQTTRYRITAERVELRSGLLNRQRTSVPRDRIRTVDLTATVLHRLFRLGVVVVHAADRPGAESGKLELDAVSTAEGEVLRRELLDRSVVPGIPLASARREPGVEPVARLHWSWLRFAPLTFSSLAGIGAVVAAAFNLLGELGVDPRDVDAVGAAAGRLASAPLWLAVGPVGALVLALAVAGALVLFVERWWGYRLTRQSDGTLRVRRGLLTHRSLSVSEERLRGVEVSEPLLLRLGGGAQTRALTTGLGRDGERGVLQPPVPRGEAHRVASATLREASDPSLTPLIRHSRAARTRRYTRALLPALAIALAALLARPWAPWLWPTALVLLPIAALLAADRYRNLGHAVTDRFVLSRIGGLHRRTIVLQRSGIIGWRVRQSPFQRRAGLVTLEAVTAAGRGGYPILDLDVAEVPAVLRAGTPEAHAFRPPDRTGRSEHRHVGEHR